MANDTALNRLWAAGQSVWYDNIRRGLIENGELGRLVAQGVRGVTSNPTIFEKAIGGSSDYDEAIRSFEPDASLDRLYDHLVRADIQGAADVLRVVFDTSEGADGFVSVEVSPYLAHDTDGTVAEALRLRALMDRPNVMIKVPATSEGCGAIRRLTAAGVSVNVTLIFSLAQYEAVIEAYIGGLEERAARGEALSGVNSVASFFVSRVDTAVDRLLAPLAEGGDAHARALLGRAAVANAKCAYALFQERFGGGRFASLAARGARVQRPLWASTGTKNPAYPDVLYVDNLIGPHTVNTMPPETLVAAMDHASVEARIASGADEAARQIAALAALGLDLDAVTRTLQVEGVRSFADSFDKVMQELRHKRGHLIGAVPAASYALGGAAEAVGAAVQALAQAGAGRRLWAKDGSLFGDDPGRIAFVPTAMGWLDAPSAMRGAVAGFEALRRDVVAAGYTDAVVLGMGGSSLCPDVLRHTFPRGPGGLRLHVLDTTHPDTVRALAAALDPARTLFVVSSKSGTTTEPNAFDRFFRAWVEKAAPADGAGAHFVAITDPGSALERLAGQEGMRAVVAGMADVGGRYSALTPFGLVPAALLGLDVDALLSRALRMASDCGPSVPLADNEALYLGAVLGCLARLGRDKVTLVAEGDVATLGDWVEQLLAESTGKEGKGLVPVVGEPLGDVQTYGADRVFVATSVGPLSEPTVRRLNALEAAGHPVVRIRLGDALDLGGEFVRWELATAIAGAVLGINPFDQPNVQESKDKTAAVLGAYRKTHALPEPGAEARDEGVEASGFGAVAGQGVEGLLAGLFSQAVPGDYVALMAYVPPDETSDRLLRDARQAIRQALGLATTLGYGPRFLHSTGQLHKGGPATGLFVQIVQAAAPGAELPIPSMDADFGTLVRAQALGDLEVLRDRHRRVVRLDIGCASDLGHATALIAAAARATVGGLARKG